MARHVREALLKAIRESGLSRYEISKRTGIEQATLSLFVRDRAGLTLGTIETLAGFLGLELRPGHKAKAMKRRAR